MPTFTVTRIGVIAAATLGLSACVEAPNNPTTQTAAGTQIALVGGKNCMNNHCFYYDPGRNTVSAPGRERVPVPRSIDTSDGAVTAAEFSRLGSIAGQAQTFSNWR